MQLFKYLEKQQTGFTTYLTYLLIDRFSLREMWVICSIYVCKMLRYYYLLSFKFFCRYYINYIASDYGIIIKRKRFTSIVRAFKTISNFR